MAIEKCEAKVYEVDFRCDICGKGYFRPTGMVYPTCPMKYPHKCTFCGAETDVVGHTYPYTETKKVLVIDGEYEE